jgi:hypothetical protein
LLFVGDDWAEAHHDIEIQDDTGRRLAGRRLPEGLAGIAALHALIAEHLPGDAGPDQVVVGIETDRGMWAQTLIAAGYQVFAINPFAASRYRDRHVTSGDPNFTTRPGRWGSPPPARPLSCAGGG